ncbi:hypothetical protein [Marivirga sp.]|uniref:hypothetical protein n=1 Tax=Marivirga sp. TaxID=2018662 RepID=UPI002D7F9262|nr:hypothetical protein [Marivirga sp.]HET8860096.1 hypothetical protein [Marivirga sp.]
MIKELKNKEISIGWDVGGWSGKNHGFCVLESIDSEIKLLMATKLTIYQIKEQIEKLLSKHQASHNIILGIDAPLQFPELFREIINENPINVFKTIQGNLKENPIAWRATDLFIKKNFGKTPLSASFSFLTSNATVAISMIGELKAKYSNFSVLPFHEEKDITAIEVYPGLLKSSSLQKNLIFNEYQQLFENYPFSEINGFDYYFHGAKEKTDVADAVICAIYALGFSGRALSVPKIKKEIPVSALAAAKSEGWIYHPDIF